MDERVPVRDDLADVDPYGAPQLDVAVRLNTNEPPYPPPPGFRARLDARLDALQLNRYPDRRLWELRTALGARFSRPPEGTWAATGSNEVLLQLFQAYGGPGRRLLLFRPGYSAHPLIARTTCTPIVEADLDLEFGLSPESAAEAVRAHAPDIICVPRPNAPTGAVFALETVRALHDAGRALVILDEAYAEFAADDAVALLDELPRLVITRTFSKAWRLAGARIGYLLAPAWVIDDIRRIRLPYHLDALTQAAGLAALDMADDMTAHVPEIIMERERVREALEAMEDVDVLPSHGNFLFFRAKTTDLFDRLLARGILVRDFSNSPGIPGPAMRVTIGTPAENTQFMTALEACVP